MNYQPSKRFSTAINTHATHFNVATSTEAVKQDEHLNHLNHLNHPTTSTDHRTTSAMQFGPKPLPSASNDYDSDSDSDFGLDSDSDTDAVYTDKYNKCC